MSQKIESFGKYILLEKLAAGGMAEVFLARSNGVSGITKFVAMKRILPQYSDNPDFIKMFKEEAKIAINLSHSNVATIFDFGVERSQFYLVMDYVEGRNLRQILNKMKKTSHKFSIDQIVYMIKEVASGLDHAHRCLDGSTGKPLNITHRDMSPQNVMISFEGEIKIIDFGIAKAESQSENTKAGTLKGKFGYMSPEQAEGQPVDLRTDIFSLGIVLWELLANDRLFISNNEINTLRKIRDCQIPSLRKINPNISPDLETIVHKALARDRNLRYQTAAALQRDLSRFLNRSFPDFSHQDFSVFIKTLYADEILELRKRLIKYSNLQAPDQDDEFEDDRTMVTRTEVSGAYEGTEYEFENTNLDDEEYEEVTEVTEVTEESYDISRSEVLESVDTRSEDSIVDEEALEKSFAATNPQIKMPDQTPAPTKGSQTRTGFHHNNTAMTQSTFRREEFTSTGMRSPSVVKKKRFSLASVSGFLIVLAVAGAAYWMLYPRQAKVLIGKIFGGHQGSHQGRAHLASKPPSPAKTLAPEKIKPRANPNPIDGQSQNPVNDPLEEEPTTFAAEPAMTNPVVGKRFTRLAVSSNPSGAEIFINGKSTGQTTPKMVNVPSDASFTLEIRKLNYRSFVRPNITINQIGRSINAKLKPSDIAYLDIDVIPPRHAKLFINGKEITDKRLPISKLSVPANTRIEIQAYNPVNKKRDWKTITVPKNQRRGIVLRLNKSSRVPSQAN